jgi:hypothetical protein
VRVCVCVCVCTHIDANTGIPARGALQGHACASGKTTRHYQISAGTCHIIIHTCHIIIPILKVPLICITKSVQAPYILCHIIIHTMSHHHTYYVTSSYILCHIIIHTMSHHHQISAGTHSQSPLYMPFCSKFTRTLTFENMRCRT